MPILKDYLKMFHGAKQKELENMKLVDEYNRFMEKEVKPFMVKELEDVFGEEVSVKLRIPKSIPEAKDLKLYNQSNLRILQLADVKIEHDVRTVEMAQFKSREDFNERFVKVVADLFD